MNKSTLFLYFFLQLYSIIAAPQQLEKNEDLQISDPVTAPPDVKNQSRTDVIIITKTEIDANKGQYAETSLSTRLYKYISEPIITVIQTPKVNLVLRNIGTCIVNGAMELFSYYLPPTFMPLVASAAGFMIPFEPVVMLKERMPVNTYRRAFKTAMKTFLDSFSQFKYDEDVDPYMTRRFNRRFMDDDRKTQRRGEENNRS